MTKTLKNILIETAGVRFSNWVRPSDEDLALEYKIEYQIKPLKQLTGDAFPDLQSFITAVDNAKIISVTDSIDRKISYRSRTKSKESLLSLIKSYASYPQFRNEKTIDAIYDGYLKNKPMKMSLVLKLQDGSMRVMGGNTRMDVGQHLGITPKVLLVTVPKPTTRGM